MSWTSGITYIHEHVTVDLSGVKRDSDARLDCLEETVAELRTLKRLGVATIVDVTNRGMGRNPGYVLAVARQAGLEVQLATGYYKEPFFPSEVYELTEKQLAEIMVRELTEGIDDPGNPAYRCRASLIGEVGSGQAGISPAEKKVMSAAAIAHRETGAPISTHTTLGRCGLDHIALFREHGVDCNKVIIGHIDLSGDAEYALRLIDAGVYIGFDTVGKLNYQPESVRLAMLSAICARGCADRVMLSMDITRKSHLKANGGLGYAYLLESFVPYLLANGISQADIDKMLIHNPAAFFAGQAQGRQAQGGQPQGVAPTER
jgi:phosphotriesterase-related protein